MPDADTVPIELPATLDAQAAEGLLPLIREAGAFHFDGAAVGKVGALGLQLLAAARAEAARTGASFRIDAPSSALLEAARALGLAEFLALEPGVGS